MLFKDRISETSSKNNEILNYNLKLSNFSATQETLEMLSAGFFTLLVYKSFIGRRAEEGIVNLFGQKRGKPVYAGATLLFMIVSWRQIDSYPRLNVNKLVNPYESNGQAMLQIVMKLYPQKVIIL